MLNLEKISRVLLKISGEALAVKTEHKIVYGISKEVLDRISNDIKVVYDMGIEIAIVVGGGNIYRGLSGAKAHGIERSQSDHMGMLATIINGIALQDALRHAKVPVRLMSSVPVPTVCENFSFNKAIHHFNKKRVVIFAGGTGNPYFTTDTAAALKAVEMKCDLLLKATKVKGVFCSDPHHNPNAQFFAKLSYEEVQNKKLEVMDKTAITFAAENNLPIAVFSIYENNGFSNIIKGIGEFSIITN